MLESTGHWLLPPWGDFFPTKAWGFTSPFNFPKVSATFSESKMAAILSEEHFR
jgi:hypothetical protein